MNGAHEIPEIGWFEKIKNYIKFDDLLKKLSESKYKLLDMALFAGIGFLIGFLWKRYANYFIAFFVFLVGLIILQQTHIIEIQIDWLRIQKCCGVEPITRQTDMPSLVWEWFKANILIVFSFIIGFCLGTKLS
jgi:uncharacterized membrane protein (Fun14 family)